MKKTINDHEHLAMLQGYYAEHRVLPSYARLMSLLGFASKSAVKKVLERLEGVGMLERTPMGTGRPVSASSIAPLRRNLSPPACRFRPAVTSTRRSPLTGF
ncbi:hypothetical protein L0Y88_04605 [Burkholderia multivorans]|uniref:LexA family protein n=1 Tax=Burkholderia multivorans TaxID=87883 RepID=UPI002018A96D|nr:hypothetical protein [Burkholderia multivorans]MCL4654303.1 hypothetical protein [Burkholderia multivorans]UQN53377.1 hypothetical protein L0Y88_04605 [Burkholderia multivorans]